MPVPTPAATAAIWATARTADPTWLVVLGGLGLLVFFTVGVVRVARGRQSFQGQYLGSGEGASVRYPLRRRAVHASVVIGVGTLAVATVGRSSGVSAFAMGGVFVAIALAIICGLPPFGTDNSKSSIWK
jgi:hypothetical protein